MTSLKQDTKIWSINKSIIFCFIISLAGMLWSLWRISFPIEINFNEAWNAWLSDLAFNSAQLYPSKNSLIINNFPPLSRIILNLFSQLPIFSNSFWAGRVLSVLSLIGTSVSIFLICNEVTNDKKISLLSSFWFCGIIFQFFSDLVGSCDNNLLTLGFMYLGFYYFLKSNNIYGIIFSLSIIFFAGLIRQNFIAVPLTILCYLLIKQRLYFVISFFYFLFLALTSIIFFYLIYGENFFFQLFQPRAWDWTRPIGVITKLQWIFVIFPFWFYWLKSSNNSKIKILTIIHMLASVSSWLFWKVGEGTADNIQLDVIASGAIISAITLNGLKTRYFDIFFFNMKIRNHYSSYSAAEYCALFMCLRLLLSFQTLSYFQWFSPTYQKNIYLRSTIVSAEIESIKALKEDVSCSIRSVCYLAGKPYIYDEYAVSQLIATKRISKSDLEEKTKNIFFVKNSKESDGTCLFDPHCR